MLRKEFDIQKEVTKATIYVTCHGLYQLQLNGKKVGDQEFTPGWTSYPQNDFSTKHMTLPIKFKPGKMPSVQLLVMAGTGALWAGKAKKNLYGEKSALLCQIRLTFSDGSEQVIVSDKSWKASTGAILASEIYHGEIYDAGLEKMGWDKPEFNDSEWFEVTEQEHGFQNLVASTGSPVKSYERVKSN